MPAQAGRLLLPGGVWCSCVELYFKQLLKVVMPAEPKLLLLPGALMWTSAPGRT